MTTKEDIDNVIDWFAQELKQKLYENLHKGSWRVHDCDVLLDVLYEELAEFEEAIDEGNVQNIIREAADVAAFVAFIADKLKTENA